MESYQTAEYNELKFDTDVKFVSITNTSLNQVLHF